MQLVFSCDDDFERVDFRAHPERYRIGWGEQGALLVEPYKSELVSFWRFRTPELAHASVEAISVRFHAYPAVGDFPGAGMVRKFLQMGYTRARRCANHKSGRKWNVDRTAVLPQDEDSVRADVAAIFKAAADRVRNDPEYLRQMTRRRARYETSHPTRSRCRGPN